VFFSFATHEYPRLAAKHIKIDEKFVLSEQIMKDYYHFIDSIGFKYQSYAQLVFDEFKTRAGIADSVKKDTTKKAGPEAEAFSLVKKPDWSKEETDVLKKVSLQMAKILEEESKREVSKDDAEIKNYLREALMVRELGQDNDVVNREKLLADDQFKSALSIIANKAAYENLLKPKTKQ
jgi:hypothetical protein